MIVLRADNPLHPDHFLRREPPIGLPLWMEGMLERADAQIGRASCRERVSDTV